MVSCVSGPALSRELCRWELTAHNCVWPLSGKVSLLQGHSRLCLLLTSSSHLQENRHMCHSKLTSLKAPVQSSCSHQDRAEKHSAILTVGKKCSWERVGPLWFRLASEAGRQGVPMPAALMLFKQRQHMQSLNYLVSHIFSLDSTHRKSLMCQKAHWLGLPGDFGQVAFDQNQAKHGTTQAQ